MFAIAFNASLNDFRSQITDNTAVAQFVRRDFGSKYKYTLNDQKELIASKKIDLPLVKATDLDSPFEYFA